MKGLKPDAQQRLFWGGQLLQGLFIPLVSGSPVCSENSFSSAHQKVNDFLKQSGPAAFSRLFSTDFLYRQSTARRVAQHLNTI